ncbi:MAG: hypothetical protein QOE89_3404 [Pseudonocardiales bacterium]|nr:hypothetical protein [Pseudonocardiales bacterium]
MCLNKKVLLGLGVVAIGLVVLQPGWAVAALPFVILAVCPLSMIFMMRGMNGRNAEAAGSRQGTQPQPFGAFTATKADSGQQVTDVQSQQRVLDVGTTQRNSEPQR